MLSRPQAAGWRTVNIAPFQGELETSIVPPRPRGSPANREVETAVAIGARTRFVGGIGTFENMREVFRSGVLSGVDNGQDRNAVSDACPDAHSAIRFVVVNALVKRLVTTRVIRSALPATRAVATSPVLLTSCYAASEQTILIQPRAYSTKSNGQHPLLFLSRVESGEFQQ